ncbi:CsbD family protein [Avibacterium sp. 21-586]|uniref:CsbD family protein n=1 Tax=Avibacterium sp. 21-586 TaxID=2911534 RepID=UPI0022475A73|nr:CsbD family protein [Avibacterium sp. 21-586]MCW9710978.1 CsbD family protein [Avibacterium sp. 21-586]
MNWEQLEGKWDQIKGTIKTKWAELTDDDLLLIEGKKDKFIGMLQERYGITKEEAEKQADEFDLDL